MFLSNQQAAAFALFMAILAAAGCSWLQPGDPAPLLPTAIAPPDTGIPFETKEPETYQADFVTIAAGAESRSHFTRRSGKWRMDTFAGEKPSGSIIQGEKLFYVDHIAKEFSEPPIDGPDPQAPFISDLTMSLLNEKQAARFEKIGRDGTLDRYSVSIDGASGPSTIVFDTSIKMVVRHEFEGGFAFEMRNFTLEVDEAIFAVPAGYRRVAWATFKQQ